MRCFIFSVACCAWAYYDPQSEFRKKEDVFDQVTKQRKKSPGADQQPDCKAPDGLSPFANLAFVGGKIYVRRELNDTNTTCEELIHIAHKNVTELMKGAKMCGPVGEVKRRIAQNLFGVFWAAGFDGWPQGEDKTILVQTDNFEGEVELSEEKFAKLEACWMEGCGCDQAQSPMMRVVFAILFVVCLSGLGYDSVMLMIGKNKKKKAKSSKKEKKEKKEKSEAKEEDEDKAEASATDSVTKDDKQSDKDKTVKEDKDKEEPKETKKKKKKAAS